MFVKIAEAGIDVKRWQKGTEEVVAGTFSLP
jgi:hypothetical protein